MMAALKRKIMGARSQRKQEKSEGIGLGSLITYVFQTQELFARRPGSTR